MEESEILDASSLIGKEFGLTTVFSIGAIDMIVASMCINRSAKLVTKDADFKQIKFVEPEFKLEIRK